MSRIKGKNANLEVLLRKALWANSIRFRIHVKTCQKNLIL